MWCLAPVVVLGTKRIRWLGHMKPRSQDYITFSMLNSAEHKIYPAHKRYAIVGILTFISMIKTTSEQESSSIVGILVFVSSWNFMLSWVVTLRSGPEVIKQVSCSTQLSTKFIIPINVKMPTIIGILTFISMLNATSCCLKARKSGIFKQFSFYEQLKFHAQLS